MSKGAVAEQAPIGRAGLPPRLGYRPREIARLTGLAPATVYKWIYTGELKAVRKGRAIIVPADEVERLLAGDAA
jgi:excisionase family DNA binding protein